MVSGRSSSTRRRPAGARRFASATALATASTADEAADAEPARTDNRARPDAGTSSTPTPSAISRAVLPEAAAAAFSTVGLCTSWTIAGIASEATSPYWAAESDCAAGTASTATWLSYRSPRSDVTARTSTATTSATAVASSSVRLFTVVLPQWFGAVRRRTS